MIIRTDSKYAINCLTEWCENWKQNSWINSKGGPGLAVIIMTFVTVALEI